ncbi:MAG TPA: hypothetical protein VFS97_09315 [Nitrososphaeraceae archaeon]|nr:hypothetical protein [Nitrososphaeraceae archaeon]
MAEMESTSNRRRWLLTLYRIARAIGMREHNQYILRERFKIEDFVLPLRKNL